MSKKDYQNWTKEQLLHELKELKKRKKFGLVWEDSLEEVVEQCKRYLPVLSEAVDKKIETSPSAPNNVLIEGDNYHALSVLNYTHRKKVDVIYIDPPYNTGNKSWKYNNHYVEEEDRYKHSKWLSFMAKRLRLAKKLLNDDGVICVTIDDNEMHRLWCLLEEVFGPENHLGTVAIRINPGGRKSKRKVALQHEYAIFFAKSSKTKVAPVPVLPDQKSHSYKQDEDGTWFEERNLRKEGQDSLAKPGAKRYYPIYYDPKTGEISSTKKLSVEILPVDTQGQKRIWRRDQSVIDDLYKNKELSARETRFGWQVYFKFKGGLMGETPKSMWDDKKYSASEHGTQTLDRILGQAGTFQFPKSPYAVEDCIRVASDKKDALVLDFFAGSGTTAQAVLEMNQQDGGTRQFIICTNNENGICEEVCYPRVEKVMKGYENGSGLTDGLGGNLRYYKTDFVDQVKTDHDKRNLVAHSTEMLCLAEDTFDELQRKDGEMALFENEDKVTAILYEEDAVEDFKKIIPKIKKPIVVYVFSYDHTYDEEDFKDITHPIEVKPIPEVILNIYRKIFKHAERPMNL